MTTVLCIKFLLERLGIELRLDFMVRRGYNNFVFNQVNLIAIYQVSSVEFTVCIACYRLVWHNRSRCCLTAYDWVVGATIVSLI